MKLITKTSRYYLLFTLPALIISALFSYFFLLQELCENDEDLLKNRILIIENHIKKGDISLLNVLTENNEIEVKTLKTSKKIEPIYTDTIIYSNIQQEYITYRLLRKSVLINNVNYKISVWKSAIVLKEIFEVIIFVFILTLVLLAITLVIINLKIAKTIWSPFFETLKRIKSFSVTSNQPIQFKNIKIDEFNELNSSILEMTEKIRLDYNNQKKFTENASHEYQTPLAIIKSKIELLLQSNILNQNELSQLMAIEDAATRLSKINKSLLLLSKIENGQFQNNTTINVLPLINKIIAVNEDFILSQEIKIINNLEANCTLKINEELAFILFNNLFQNAIRHNYNNGVIYVKNNANTIEISNTGDLISLEKEPIFERFTKNTNNQNSIGLGLSIVKEIAVANKLKISYSFKDNLHCITIFKEH